MPSIHTYILAILLLFCTLTPTAAADSSAALDSIIPCTDSTDWGCNKIGDSSVTEEDNGFINTLPTADARSELAPLIARTLLFGMAAVAFIMFSIAAGMYLLFPGDEDSAKKANMIFVYGIVGMAIAAAAYVVVRSILNIDI